MLLKKPFSLPLADTRGSVTAAESARALPNRDCEGAARSLSPQPAGILESVASLEEAARHGDWRGAGELAAGLRQQKLPTDHKELGEYLLHLKEALVTAKISRAHAAASLARFNAAAVRLNAAASFHRVRQEFAGTTDF
jgi:hypothetical protein